MEGGGRLEGKTDGNFFSFGSHKDGKLGIADPKVDVLIPTYVKGLAEKPVELVGVGCDHSAVVTEDNEVLTWGFGQHAALGHGDSIDYPVPTVLKPFTTGQIVDIEAGQDLTVASVVVEQQE